VTRVEKDPSWNGHGGRIQTLIEDGTLEKSLGGPPDPDNLSVFICGNPEMVDDVKSRFEGMGFQVHSKKEPGNLHIERYW
jgi:ferredoxin--NADP+ reductase